MTYFLNVKIRIKGRDNLVSTGARVNLKNVKIEINGNNNQLIIDNTVKFYEGGYILFEGNNCEIRIGKGTTIGSANIFCAESNTSIKIGEDCMLSRDIRIATGDFHSIIDRSTNKRINGSMNISIGNHVWIGARSMIIKGAGISHNCIVGLCTIVNKNYNDENVILAGIPSKIIKSNITWDRSKLPIEE